MFFALYLLALSFFVLAACCTLENAALFGDAVGGLSAVVVGGISIWLLYCTLREQQKFSREQAQIAKDEQFKSTLFNLLTEQRDIAGKLKEWMLLIEEDCVSTKKYKVSELNVFSMLRYHLKLLHNALEVQSYNNKSFDSGEICEDIMGMLYQSKMNITGAPQEIVERHNKETEGTTQMCRALLTIDYYKITKHEYNRYKALETTEQKIRYLYNILYSKHNSFGYYFRHLYHILKFINGQELEEIKRRPQQGEAIKEKYMGYAQFIQSQMSDAELTILFYNTFLFPKMRTLVEKYRLLENLPIECLVSKEHDCIKEFNLSSRGEFYPTAFWGNEGGEAHDGNSCAG